MSSKPRALALLSSQVTRSADSASMTGANFSSWYRADEGTFYGEMQLVSSLSGGRFYEANDGTDNNRMFLSVSSGTHAYVGYNSVAQFSVVITVGLSSKTAFGYKTNDFAFSLNGASTVLGTSGNIPTVACFAIGSNAPNTGGQLKGGTIKRIAYYPKRLSNTELQALTS